MQFLLRNYRIIAFLNVLILGGGTIWMGSAFADPPLGIAGDVTVQNDATNPVPVTIQNSPTTQPVIIRLSTRDPNFDGKKDIFLVSGGLSQNSVCVGGAVPVCEFGSVNYIVPADMVLVIRHISARSRVLSGTVPPASSAKFNMQIVGAAVPFGFNLGLLDFTDSVSNTWEKGFTVHLTAPAGTELAGVISWQEFGAADAEGSLVIYGDLVSAQ